MTLLNNLTNFFCSNIYAITIITLLGLYSIFSTLVIFITRQKLQITQNYNNTLSLLYDDVKAFKHDFENIVHTIGGYIDSNNMRDLKIFYKSLNKDCKRVNNIALLNPNIINNPGIYNLFMSKYNKAKELGIELNLDFFFDLKKLKMPIYEFSRMFGILLDNAIEAASEAEHKEINISFRDSQKNHIQLINIENTYTNKNIDTKHIYEKGITEKTNHMGMGLWEVNQIIKRINNINLNTLNDEKYFKQKLEIYY